MVVGLYENISCIRGMCWKCDSNAPSQSREPPVPFPRFEDPFHQICSDYLSLEGNNYLVVLDPYLGWPSDHKAKTGNDAEILREHCETFGVPKELATDGGLTLLSRRTQSSLSSLLIRHRLSLAYNSPINLEQNMVLRA